MTFHSVLFQRSEDRRRAETAEVPAFFRDLNLDQIIDAATAGKQAYDLKPFFHTSLHDIDAIKYRHEVFQDLENAIVLQHIHSFAQRMRAMRDHIVQADKLSYKYQKQRWFLDSVGVYCDAVNDLADDLSGQHLGSRALLGFREYLKSYTGSSRFTTLQGETQKLNDDLSTIKYCIHIKGDGFKVRKYQSETDYSAEVEETFEKFKLGAVKDYRIKFAEPAQMNHIEEKVLEFVARLHPEIFTSLDTYCGRNTDYLDGVIAAFDREIQFYIAYVEHLEMFRRTGLKFCYPNLSDQCKEICNNDGFDLALAYKLIRDESPVVANDFYLQGEERIFVVSGPNQGGKTTFSRMFGQLHYLASLGCPVQGREAQLFLYDRIFTHFQREEDIKDLRGKLQDDLVRIHDMLEQATTSSIFIMNEIFTSTAVQDALFLSEEVMKKIIELGALCVWVTFIDELASFGEQIVSMVSTVVPENPTLRTFKVIRKAADGLAYAMSVAEKYQLTYRQLQERIK